MPPPISTPPGTDVAGTYYFLDSHIAAEGRQYKGVVSGLQVTASGTPSLVLQVSAGAFHQGDVSQTTHGYTGGTVTLSTADANYTRIDVISVYWNAGGSVAQIVATPGAANDNSSPLPVPSPPISDGVRYNIVLAVVLVYPTQTAIPDDQIWDRRFFLPVASVASVGANNEVVIWDTDGRLANSGRTINSVGNIIGVSAPTVDGQVVLYQGVDGTLVKNATASGRPLLTSGVQSVGPINLASEVTGDLPLANLAQASAATTLLGRGAASGAGDYQEITVGANLTMTGTTLAATGGGGSGDVVGPSASVDDEVVLYSGTTGKLIKRASATGRPKLTAGVQSVGAIDLASEVTGDLPLANLAQASAASRLLLRGAAAGAGDWEEGTLGSGLSLAGTVLSSTGGGGAPFATAQGSYNTDSTERDLLSMSIPSGTLGASGGILWHLMGTILANSGTPTWTLRVKLAGSPRMGDASATIAASANRRSLTLRGIVVNNSAANAQVYVIDGAIGAITAGSVAGIMDIAAAATATFALITGTGSGTTDTATTTVTFAVTSQFSVSNVAVEIAWKAVAYLI